MGGINFGKVLTSGLLAGLIMNIGEYILNELLLKERWAAATAALNIPQPEGGLVVFFLAWGFVFGIGMVWLYAAIRPRFGAGPKTAVCAGLTAWFLMSFMGFGPTAAMGLFPGNLVLITLVWELVELPLSTVIGARFYSE